MGFLYYLLNLLPTNVISRTLDNARVRWKLKLQVEFYARSLGASWQNTKNRRLKNTHKPKKKKQSTRKKKKWKIVRRQEGKPRQKNIIKFMRDFGRAKHVKQSSFGIVGIYIYIYIYISRYGTPTLA